MIKIDKLVEEHKDDNTIIIDIRKYNGSFDTSNLPLGQRVLYITHRVSNKQLMLLDCEVCERQHCQTCPLREFTCSNADCNLKLNKIYRV